MDITFEQRLMRLSGTSGHSTATPPVLPALSSSKPIGPIAVIFYGLLGFAFAMTTTFMNVNYERITDDMSAGIPAVTLVFTVLIGFAALSLLLMALMLLIALGQSLFGKKSKSNWLRLGVFVAGLSLGGVATTTAPLALYYMQLMSLLG